jgi:methionine biosynthesis protein MetW
LSYGLVYRSPALYRLAMRLLDHGGSERRRMIADEVPAGASVVDLCCGDSAIAPLLLAKGCSYLGLELNARFVESSRARGLDVRQWDARSFDVPPGDVICMLSSLYQFIPDERLIFTAMIEQASTKVIVSEPTENWASSSSRLLRAIAHRLTMVDGRAFPDRHTTETLDRLLEQLPPGSFETRFLGREIGLFVDTAAVRAAGAG